MLWLLHSLLVFLTGLVWLFGIMINPWWIPHFVIYLLKLHRTPPHPKKPPWHMLNDAHADKVCPFLGFLILLRLLLATDPYWPATEPHPPYPMVKNRPPPDPDPLDHPYQCPLHYKVHSKTHLPTLRRLYLLHKQECRHHRLLALHGRLLPSLSTHLVMHFRPAVPLEPVPPWTNEGDLSNHDQKGHKVLQVHPTFAKTIRVTQWQKLEHAFSTALGFSTQTNFEDEPALDLDSKPFGIDPMASATISNNKDEFINLRPLSKTYLAGVGGKVPVEGQGTLCWTIEDDLGSLHNLEIRNAYYCSAAPLRLLCPQQWAAQREQTLGPDHNTSFTTKAQFSRLNWSTYSLTIPHDDKTNLPLWRTAPSYHKVAMNVSTPIIPSEPAIVTDDEESDEDAEGTCENGQHKQIHFPFDQDARARQVIKDTHHVENLTNDQLELLRLHNKYGHISFKLLQNLASQGLIPKKLGKCEKPTCPSCLYGKQTKRPWRTKASPMSIGGRKPSKPGECVSVDQMISKTPSLMAQVKGWLTKKRYTAATVFADHASGLSYVHVTESTTAEETLEAKAAFEAYAADMGVTIKHYHADNGRFAENAFMEHVKASGQSITFCGVGAHHQNGVAERRIRDLTEHSRTMLLHASHRWPKSINVHLWPYALRLAAHIRNHIPRETEGGTPIQDFSGSDVHNKVFHKHQHTFGCPVYVLDAPLQSGLGTKPKWSERSQVGAYLGHSSNHAQSVALVLNLKLVMFPLNFI